MRDLFGNPPDAATAGEKLKRAFEVLAERGRLTGIATAGGPNGAGRDGDMANARQKADALSKLEG